MNWSMDCLNDGASDVPSIILFRNFLQKILQKSFQFVFYKFAKIEKRLLNALSSSQQPTVLFLIYQNNTWVIRRLVDPLTQHIILKIVGFQGTNARAMHNIHPLLICTWFLKSLVYQLDIGTWFFTLVFNWTFLFISNWNFAGYTSNKNQVLSIQTIKFKNQVDISQIKCISMW